MQYTRTYTPGYFPLTATKAIIDFTPLSNGIVAYWSMDESSAGTGAVSRADSTGRGNTLTDNNTTPSGTGIISNGAAMAKANGEYLYIADNADVSMGSTSFTISVWAKANSFTAGAGVVSKTVLEYGIYHDGTYFQFIVANGGNSRTVNSNTACNTTGTWYHVVAWYDAAAGTVNISVNGDTPHSLAYTFGALDGAQQLRIGNQSGGLWDGIIDEVGVWKRVLTSAERSWLYNTGLGLAWPFTGIGAGTAPTARNVIFDGDSLTWGGGTPPRPYPYQAMTAILAGYANYTYSNVGVAGKTLVNLLSDAPGKVDILKRTGLVNVCVLCAGINDLYPSGSAVTAATVYSNLQTYVTARRAAGFDKVYVTTLTPVDPAISGGRRADYETVRQQLNTLLRASPAGADGLIDPGGDAIIGNESYTTNTTYFTDGLHMTTAGYAIWAALAKTVILTA